MHAQMQSLCMCNNNLKRNVYGKLGEDLSKEGMGGNMLILYLWIMWIMYNMKYIIVDEIIKRNVARQSTCF